MPILRTPAERFAQLPEFPFTPHYLDLQAVQIHYVDEGRGQPILCLHGEPTWSFLYRKMIPPLAQVGRVIAPDLIGFGRSDKYSEMEDYSFQMHYDMLTQFIETLDLRDITLVCHDWGGILGLPLAALHAERFARLVILNTGLMTGDFPITEGFRQWRDFAERTGRELRPGQLMMISSPNSTISPEVQFGYDAPFPDASYRAGVAAFPLLLPLKPDDPGAALSRAARDHLQTWTKPALVLFSDNDPVTQGGDRYLRQLIPSAQNEPEITIHGAGHFLQEEQGETLAAHIVEFIGRHPL